MQFLPEHAYHVYNQGNNKERIFFKREHYVYFLNKIRKYICPHANVLAWCLMPNHYHLLLHIKPEYEVFDSTENLSTKMGSLNRGIGTLQSSYAQALNKERKKSGSLFRARAKSNSLNENHTQNDGYGINCFLYIHQNPIRAGLVEKLEDWEFSSYQDYIGLRNGKLCNKKLAEQLFHLPKDVLTFKEFSFRTIPDSFLKTIFR